MMAISIPPTAPKHVQVDAQQIKQLTAGQGCSAQHDDDLAAIFAAAEACGCGADGKSHR